MKEKRKEKRKWIKGQKCHDIVLASVCKFIMCVNLCLCGLWLRVYATGLMCGGKNMCGV